MTETPYVNCASYILSELGVCPDVCIDPDRAAEEYLQEVRQEDAEVIAVVDAEGVIHMALYDPARPDEISHRPDFGVPVRKGDSYYGAIGHLVRPGIDVRYFRRK